ncbi:cyclase family protein [Enterovirga sp.]|jgi:kynurenine formamidase|uniref:cyclase family protein n=1 Tax=Enterovirga sp. TaxID=2026350 RepID=UPI0026079DC5|nr:cyclase family protein [Enterovirga sp.]MDB5591036.1 cyclase family protein [Enterovirga sp.]
MEIVDLSRELFHRTQTHPSHPPVVMTVWNDHSEKKVAGDVVFSSKALSIAFSDHAGTHVDAPVHFDPRPGALSIDQVPLEKFITSAFCVDLRDVPLKHAVTVEELQGAVKASGETIRQGDTVLILLGTNARLLGKPGYGHDFPGLSIEAIHWLADQGIGMFGVEAISPSPEGALNFRAHMACAERGITHMECLANLEAVVGRGRFRFIGLPLKIRGGTASPIRAVALFE